MKIFGDVSAQSATFDNVSIIDRIDPLYTGPVIEMAGDPFLPLTSTNITDEINTDTILSQWATKYNFQLPRIFKNGAEVKNIYLPVQILTIPRNLRAAYENTKYALFVPRISGAGYITEDGSPMPLTILVSLVQDTATDSDIDVKPREIVAALTDFMATGMAFLEADDSGFYYNYNKLCLYGAKNIINSEDATEFKVWKIFDQLSFNVITYNCNKNDIIMDLYRIDVTPGNRSITALEITEQTGDCITAIDADIFLDFTSREILFGTEFGKLYNTSLLFDNLSLVANLKKHINSISLQSSTAFRRNPNSSSVFNIDFINDSIYPAVALVSVFNYGTTEVWLGYLSKTEHSNIVDYVELGGPFFNYWAAIPMKVPYLGDILRVEKKSLSGTFPAGPPGGVEFEMFGTDPNNVLKFQILDTDTVDNLSNKANPFFELVPIRKLKNVSKSRRSLVEYEPITQNYPVKYTRVLSSSDGQLPIQFFTAFSNNNIYYTTDLITELTPSGDAKILPNTKRYWDSFSEYTNQTANRNIQKSNLITADIDLKYQNQQYFLEGCTLNYVYDDDGSGNFPGTAARNGVSTINIFVKTVSENLLIPNISRLSEYGAIELENEDINFYKDIFLKNIDELYVIGSNTSTREFVKITNDIEDNAYATRTTSTVEQLPIASTVSSDIRFTCVAGTNTHVYVGGTSGSITTYDTTTSDELHPILTNFTSGVIVKQIFVIDDDTALVAADTTQDSGSYNNAASILALFTRSEVSGELGASATLLLVDDSVIKNVSAIDSNNIVVLLEDGITTIKTDDGGITWEYSTTPLSTPTNNIAYSPFSNSKILVYANNAGIQLDQYFDSSIVCTDQSPYTNRTPVYAWYGVHAGSSWPIIRSSDEIQDLSVLGYEIRGIGQDKIIYTGQTINRANGITHERAYPVPNYILGANKYNTPPTDALQDHIGYDLYAINPDYTRTGLTLDRAVSVLNTPIGVYNLTTFTSDLNNPALYSSNLIEYDTATSLTDTAAKIEYLQNFEYEDKLATVAKLRLNNADYFYIYRPQINSPWLPLIAGKSETTTIQLTGADVSVRYADYFQSVSATIRPTGDTLAFVYLLDTGIESNTGDILPNFLAGFSIGTFSVNAVRNSQSTINTPVLWKTQLNASGDNTELVPEFYFPWDSTDLNDTDWILRHEGMQLINAAANVLYVIPGLNVAYVVDDTRTDIEPPNASYARKSILFKKTPSTGWSMKFIPDSSRIYSISFLSETIGFAVVEDHTPTEFWPDTANISVRKTTNGGETWETILVRPKDFGMSFFNTYPKIHAINENIQVWNPDAGGLEKIQFFAQTGETVSTSIFRAASYNKVVGYLYLQNSSAVIDFAVANNNQDIAVVGYHTTPIDSATRKPAFPDVGNTAFFAISKDQGTTWKSQDTSGDLTDISDDLLPARLLAVEFMEYPKLSTLEIVRDLDTFASTIDDCFTVPFINADTNNLGDFSYDCNANGSNNVGIGADILGQLSSANIARLEEDVTETVAVGHNAAGNSTYSKYNVAIGSNAMIDVLRSEENIAIGYSSMGGGNFASSTRVIANKTIFPQNVVLSNDTINLNYYNNSNGGYVSYTPPISSSNPSGSIKFVKSLTDGTNIRNIIYGHDLDYDPRLGESGSILSSFLLESEFDNVNSSEEYSLVYTSSTVYSDVDMSTNTIYALDNVNGIVYTTSDFVTWQSSSLPGYTSGDAEKIFVYDIPNSNQSTYGFVFGSKIWQLMQDNQWSGSSYTDPITVKSMVALDIPYTDIDEIATSSYSGSLTYKPSVIAVGDNGQIIFTNLSISGSDWQPIVQTVTTESLNSILVDNNIIYIAGDLETLIKSEDYGLSWSDFEITPTINSQNIININLVRNSLVITTEETDKYIYSITTNQWQEINTDFKYETYTQLYDKYQLGSSTNPLDNNQDLLDSTPVPHIQKNIVIGNSSLENANASHGVVGIGSSVFNTKQQLFRNIKPNNSFAIVGNFYDLTHDSENHRTSGYGTVAIGTYSNYKTINSSYNTAVGYATLYDAYNANYNTAIGFYSQHVSLNNRNTSVGVWALGLNGIPNISIQNDLEYTFNGGNDNIAIGVKSLLYNTYSQKSSQLLTTSGILNTIKDEGSNNIAIGNSALLNANGVKNTVAIGNKALKDRPGDINNAVFIGANAGISFKTPSGSYYSSSIDTDWVDTNAVGIGANVLTNHVGKNIVGIGTNTLRGTLADVDSIIDIPPSVLLAFTDTSYQIANPSDAVGNVDDFYDSFINSTEFDEIQTADIINEDIRVPSIFDDLNISISNGEIIRNAKITSIDAKQSKIYAVLSTVVGGINTEIPNRLYYPLVSGSAYPVPHKQIKSTLLKGDVSDGMPIKWNRVINSNTYSTYPENLFNDYPGILPLTDYTFNAFSVTENCIYIGTGDRYFVGDSSDLWGNVYSGSTADGNTRKNAKIFKSSDEGQTFDIIFDLNDTYSNESGSITSNSVIHDIKFADDDIGYALARVRAIGNEFSLTPSNVVDQIIIYKTTNGGQSWSSIYNDILQDATGEAGFNSNENNIYEHIVNPTLSISDSGDAIALFHIYNTQLSDPQSRSACLVKISSNGGTSWEDASFDEIRPENTSIIDINTDLANYVQNGATIEKIIDYPGSIYYNNASSIFVSFVTKFKISSPYNIDLFAKYVLKYDGSAWSAVYTGYENITTQLDTAFEKLGKVEFLDANTGIISITDLLKNNTNISADGTPISYIEHAGKIKWLTTDDGGDNWQYNETSIDDSNEIADGRLYTALNINKNMPLVYTSLSQDNTAQLKTSLSIQDSIAIGTNTQPQLSSITNNIAIGDNIQLNSSGSALDSVQVGYESMRSAFKANDTVAVGMHSLFSTAYSNKITAVGKNALYNLLDDESGRQYPFNNTYFQWIGGELLQKNRGEAFFTSSCNTVVGYNAGYGLTVGEANVFVGCNSGRDRTRLDGLTSGHNNIIIGTNAAKSIPFVSNEIGIGNEMHTIAFLWGQHQAPNPWIVQSDARDKANTGSFTAGLDFIREIQPKSFQWDGRFMYPSGSSPDGTYMHESSSYGYIAQDLESAATAAGIDPSIFVKTVSGSYSDYTGSYEMKLIVPGMIDITTVNAIKEIDAYITQSKYAANLGDGESTQFIITHSLATRDIIAMVYSNLTNQVTYPTMSISSDNTITVDFGLSIPEAGEYRIVVMR